MRFETYFKVFVDNVFSNEDSVYFFDRDEAFGYAMRFVPMCDVKIVEVARPARAFQDRHPGFRRERVVYHSFKGSSDNHVRFSRA